MSREKKGGGSLVRNFANRSILDWQCWLEESTHKEKYKAEAEEFVIFSVAQAVIHTDKLFFNKVALINCYIKVRYVYRNIPTICRLYL